MFMGWESTFISYHSSTYYRVHLYHFIENCTYYWYCNLNYRKLVHSITENIKTNVYFRYYLLQNHLVSSDPTLSNRNSTKTTGHMIKWLYTKLQYKRSTLYFTWQVALVVSFCTQSNELINTLPQTSSENNASLASSSANSLLYWICIKDIFNVQNKSPWF